MGDAGLVSATSALTYNGFNVRLSVTLDKEGAILFSGWPTLLPPTYGNLAESTGIEPEARRLDRFSKPSQSQTGLLSKF